MYDEMDMEVEYELRENGGYLFIVRPRLLQSWFFDGLPDTEMPEWFHACPKNWVLA